jgi:glycerol-3-phosphate dehydrogenase
MDFSSINRDNAIAQLSTTSFDVLVIGGGITGAGIALDAAARGLTAALIEKTDFAYGTSSRSTKLIHGGLRYLKQLEFGLVKEVGSERAIVHALAPHLVVPEKMLLPLYEKRGLGYFLTSVGLKLYDWLAGVKQEDQRKMLTRPQTLKYEPLLKSDDVKGGAIYAEYRTDDARLTIEIAKKAYQYGAVLANYCEAKNFIYAHDGIESVEVLDKISKKTFTVSAKVVVNAAGPWVDTLREINRSKTNKYLHLTKGVHIVVPYHRLPVRQAIYFDVPDGRMIFAIPRGRITYVGTTDTDYKGDTDEVYTNHQDARYLIDAVNETFPSVRLTMADVESSWAGLRPLIHEEGKSASELSRKDEIFESPTGLISIAGGKLTGYRKMAERVVDLVIKRKFEELPLKKCFTHSIRFTPSPLKNSADARNFEKTIVGRVEALSLKGEDASYLVHLYGSQAEIILQKMSDIVEADPETRLAKAMAWFGIHHEMVVNAEDFYVRRSGMLYFDLPRMQRTKAAVLHFMAAELQWTDEILQNELQIVDSLLQKTISFKHTP